MGEERVTGPVPPHQSGLIDFVPSDYFAEFCAQLLFEALLNEVYSHPKSLCQGIVSMKKSENRRIFLKKYVEIIG